MQECFKRSDVKIAYLRLAIPLAEAAQGTNRELEEAKKIIADLKEENAKLTSSVGACRDELNTRNSLLTEMSDTNSTLTEMNEKLTRELKGMP